MWPFRRKTRQRRLEVRKNIPSAGLSLMRRFRLAGGVGSLLVAIVFFACLVLMDVWPIDPLPHVAGQYIPGDLHARVSFETPSKELEEQAVRHARNATPATFRLQEHLLDEIVRTLRGLPDRLRDKALADLDESLREQFGLTTEKNLEAWRSYEQADARDAYAKQIEALAVRLANLHIATPADIAQQRKRLARQVWLVAPRARKLQNLNRLISPDETDLTSRDVRRMMSPIDKPIRENIRTYLLGVFSKSRVLYRLDNESTQKDIEEAVRAQEMLPHTELHLTGKVLVRRGRRKVGGVERIFELGERDLALLRAEHEAFQEAERRDHPWRMWQRVAGRAGVLALIAIALCAYVARYKSGIVRNHWRGLALATVTVLMLALTKVMISTLGWNRHSAVLPVLLVAIIVAIAYDQRFALALATLTASLVVLQLRADMGMLVVLLAGVAPGVFALREVRTRSKLIRVSALTAVVLAAAVWARALALAVPWKFAMIDSLWGAGFALLTGFLAQGVLPLIERVFRIATSMTLLEWCDASKPLMKRLSMEAPGTFNHSLQLGAMSEAAAEAIGASGLRARVGAYYHDIGKINKPEYFVENQDGRQSKHEKLSPAMSLLIIIGHVKDGIELAREYGLPRTLHEFIETHHGTTLVEYFYHAATEQGKAAQQRVPEEFEFRYPGPKPGSKEAAILMLADAAESSVRAMPEPAPSRIDSKVHQMVTRRLMDGQLDGCELTLREVNQIERALVKTLCGIYHARIAYPTTPGAKPTGAGAGPPGESVADAAGARAQTGPATRSPPRPFPARPASPHAFVRGPTCGPVPAPRTDRGVLAAGLARRVSCPHARQERPARVPDLLLAASDARPPQAAGRADRLRRAPGGRPAGRGGPGRRGLRRHGRPEPPLPRARGSNRRAQLRPVGRRARGHQRADRRLR